MKFLHRQTTNSPKFKARAERLSSEEIQEGVDQSLSNLTAYWAEYQRSKDKNLLNEFLLTSEALYTLGLILEERQENPGMVFRPARQFKRY